MCLVAVYYLSFFRTMTVFYLKTIVLGGLWENIFQYPFGVSSEFLKHLFTCLNSYSRQMPFD